MIPKKTKTIIVQFNHLVAIPGFTNSETSFFKQEVTIRPSKPFNPKGFFKLNGRSIAKSAKNKKNKL